MNTSIVQSLKEKSESKKLPKDFSVYDLTDKWLENFVYSISDVLLHERGVKESGTMTFYYLNLRYVSSKVSNIKNQSERLWRGK